VAKRMFKKLNDDWNAEPNAPFEEVEVAQPDVLLRFRLNHWRYKQFQQGDIGVPRFSDCSRWRQGADNMDAFGYRQATSRYRRAAPAWGEFYEIVGDDPLRNQPDDWQQVGTEAKIARHFLFYFRDSSFECVANDWSFSVDQASA
jgi:hypothetical protein